MNKNVINFEHVSRKVKTLMRMCSTSLPLSFSLPHTYTYTNRENGSEG
jgi:hypothetical protein